MGSDTKMRCPGHVSEDLASGPGLGEAAGSVATWQRPPHPGITCACGTIGNPEELRRCEEHHSYWWGDRRLTGVTSVIKECFPTTYDGVSPEVLENARDRGTQLDTLVSAYVIGELTEYPKGTRYEVIDLFTHFMDWWDRQGFKDVRSQYAVHDTEFAGTMDIFADGIIFDLKCTYDVKYVHQLQVAGYSDLERNQRGGVVIHLTKRYNGVRLVELSDDAYDDWLTTRKFWKLKQATANR